MDWPALPSRKPEEPAKSPFPPKSCSPSPSREPSPPSVPDDDLLILMELQRQFDDEDHRLRNEREALTSVQPSTFTCSVCTDEHSEEFVARVQGCGHGFCRDCLKQYTASKLDEHRFPIMCPNCVADNTGKEPGSKPSVLCQY